MGVFITARWWESAMCWSRPSASHRRRSSRRATVSRRDFGSSWATRSSWRWQRLGVGSQPRGQRLRLLRVRAEVDDRTDRTERSRSADATAVQNEGPRHFYPVLLRIDRPQARFDVRTRAMEAEALGHSSHVAVDGHRGDAKGSSKDDRCRLATDAMEAGEAFHIRGHLSTEVFDQPAGHLTKRSRLLVEEARRFDVPLEDAR